MFVIKSGNMILCKHTGSNTYTLRTEKRPRYSWIRVVVTESREDIESIKETIALASGYKHFVVEELTKEEEHGLLMEVLSY